MSNAYESLGLIETVLLLLIAAYAIHRTVEARKTEQSYHAYLQSAKWRLKARACKMRAGWRCEECGADGRLEAHHLTYERIFHERLSDLMALCGECHGARHRVKV